MLIHLFSFSTVGLPQVKKGGEDAFFCVESGQTSYIGVSDGVGGWATLGEHMWRASRSS